MKPQSTQSVIWNFEGVGLITAQCRDFDRPSGEFSELESILILTVDVEDDYACMPSQMSPLQKSPQRVMTGASFLSSRKT